MKLIWKPYVITAGCGKACKIVVESNGEGNKGERKKQVDKKAEHPEQKEQSKEIWKNYGKRALAKQRPVTKTFVINMEVRF